MMKTEKPQTPLDFFDLENDENLTDHAPLMTQELKCNSSEMFSKYKQKTQRIDCNY
jgi:hypothetical protein